MCESSRCGHDLGELVHQDGHELNLKSVAVAARRRMRDGFHCYDNAIRGQMWPKLPNIFHKLRENLN